MNVHSRSAPMPLSRRLVLAGLTLVPPFGAAARSPARLAIPRSASRPARAADIALAAELEAIHRAFPGQLGIAVTEVGKPAILGENRDLVFPQQSVSKLWVALTVLDAVDRGVLGFAQQLAIGRDDLTVFNQPLRRRLPSKGELHLTIAELLEQALVHSDNLANDTLLRAAGGPQAVRRLLRDRGLGAIRFGPGERLLQSRIAGLTWDQSLASGNRFREQREALPLSQRSRALARYLADPPDGASPTGIVIALSRLARGRLLEPATTRWLLDCLARTASGPNRLKGGLPPGWSLLHKTGTGQILGNLATGYNDVGLLRAPDRRTYAVAVMIGSTTASIPARMRMMHRVVAAIAAAHRLGASGAQPA